MSEEGCLKRWTGKLKPSPQGQIADSGGVGGF